MFTQIVYLPKFGNEPRSHVERLAITGIYKAGNHLRIPVWEWNEHEETDLHQQILFVSLGGDGTMLTAMRESTKYSNSTVLGINLGKLGFLTSTDDVRLSGMYQRSDNVYYTLVMDIFYCGNNFQLVPRMSIGAKINGRQTHLAINEILVTTPTRRNPLQYDILINDQFVATQQGDGVIIATAAGSTAYALSAGGAIMTPSSTALQIVPLAAHTLTAKPIIVMDTDKISIKASMKQRANKISVFNDGCEAFTFSNNDISYFELDITNHKAVNVWYPKDWDFFNVLNTKMGW